MVPYTPTETPAPEPPPLGGARVVGRVGNWDLALLNVQTGREADIQLPSQNLAVARLRRKRGPVRKASNSIARVEDVPTSIVRIKGVSTESAIAPLPTHGSAISAEVTPGHVEERAGRDGQQPVCEPLYPRAEDERDDVGFFNFPEIDSSIGADAIDAAERVIAFHAADCAGR